MALWRCGVRLSGFGIMCACGCIFGDSWKQVGSLLDGGAHLYKRSSILAKYCLVLASL